MGAVEDLAAWAWARHHNEWSWWIRPFFLLPYCWFAWRRSLAGILLTLVALLTSMAWFRAPAAPSPMAVAVLAAERDYLLGPWGPAKIAVALLVPGTLAALAIAFWRRSFAWGVAVVNAMVLAKIAWTFVVFTGEGALHHLTPAAFGLLACNLVLLVAWRRWRTG
ncbi:hypothetical protein [Neoroseomonas rubea]|uniref:hypothetical protein n=1 Tax=Neoroseomonas rubea TaxID=2748666 RepID=UPI0018E05495|nr:hypothetical protein [Roseomonas rubea]